MAKYEVPSTSVFREKDYNVKKLIIAHYYGTTITSCR